MTHNYFRLIICSLNKSLLRFCVLLKTALLKNVSLALAAWILLFHPISVAEVSLETDLSYEPETTTSKPKISIVVDDLGDNSIIAKKIASLPAKLTLAILPQTPHSHTISDIAAKQGHEVIMHLPMEALSRPDLLGPGALYEVMDEQEFEETLLTDAKSVPDLIGFNNHMGSLLTQSPEKMHLLMKLAKENNWYFLDSKTTDASIAQNVAKQKGLSTIGRDVFLDHHGEKSDLPMVIQTQFEKAKNIATLRGSVVVICHPYQETYNFLQDNLPELADEFEFVKLSELMEKTEAKIAKID